MGKSDMDSQRLEFASDPYRPGYHYLAPANWMNDPNGTIFWKGRYHIFYCYNPHGAFQDTIHWGHAVSEDLVHWQDLPIALAPTPGDPDEKGIYSGGAFVNRDGIPTITYYGELCGICIATSGDDMLVNWEKHPANPVIPDPGPADPYTITGSPCAWIEGDSYYTITGNSSRDTFAGKEPDRAYLFRSNDLVMWEYMHPLYEGGVYTERGEDCAVPDFFPLGDKHVLLFASHHRGPHCYIGTYSNHKFTPQRHRRFAFGETKFSVRAGILNECRTLLDGANRRILFSRMSEGRYGYVQRASGWSGIFALPMVLSLSDDEDLLIDPVEELEILRGDHKQICDMRVASDSTVTLDDVKGDRLELAAVFDWDRVEEFGLAVRCSPDGREQTLIRFNTDPNQNNCPEVPTTRELVLDVTRSSSNPDVSNRESQRCHLELPQGQPLELRVFVDRSVVEVVANRRHYLAKRIYPALSDSLGVQLFARGGDARLRTLDAWRMDAVWPIT